MTSSSTSTAAPCPGDIGKPSEKAYTGPVPDVLPAQRYSRTTNSLRTAQKYPLFFTFCQIHTFQKLIYPLRLGKLSVTQSI